MKYIVMECHPAHAVLMDEQGRFVKAANRHYEVGQTVTDPMIASTPRRRYVPSLKLVRRTVLAMAACLLVVLGIARLAAAPSPYASVVMSINPSVRMDMDKSGDVIRTVGLNADGKTLLEGYRFEKATLVSVTDDLIERATEMGYLKDNGTVSFEVQCRDEAKKTYYEQTLASHTESVTAGRRVTVEIKDSNANPTGSTTVTTAETTAQTTPATQQTIGILSEKEALSAALREIGVSLSQVNGQTVERDVENGNVVYDIEFTVNGVEYECYVDAVSGDVLTAESEADTEHDD